MAIDYQKLKKIREELHKTQQQMAEELGVPLRTYRSYEQGQRDMGSANLLHFCQTFKVSADDLLGNYSVYGDAYQEIKTVNGQTLFMIPVYMSADDLISESAIDQVPELFGTKKEALETIAIKVSGDAMSPKIDDRDIVIVHKQNRVRNDDIIAATISGKKGIYIRRIFQKDGVINLQPINTESETLTFNDANDVKVIGVVKKLMKNLK